jgi:hypothetical protein
MGPTRRPADPLGQQRPWRRRERPAALAASSARPRHARASRLERSRPHSRRGAPPAGSRSRRDGPAASGAQGHQRAAGWVSPRAPLKVGGGTSTKGDMVARLHERLTAGLPDGFTRALAVASACTSLQNLQHQAGAFEAELRKTARESGIVEVSEHARTMGTLGNDLRSPRPVHDLYWSWLVGVGLIESAAVVQAIHRLDLGESLELAAQSGIRPDPSVICQFAGSWGQPFAGTWGQGGERNDFTESAASLVRCPSPSRTCSGRRCFAGGWGQCQRDRARARGCARVFMAGDAGGGLAASSVGLSLGR